MEIGAKLLILCNLRGRISIKQKKTTWDSTDSTAQVVLLLGMGAEAT